MLEFLRDKAQKNDLYFRFKRFSVLAIKWQREWRNRLKQDKIKMELLSAMWDKEKNIMKEYYMSNLGMNRTLSSPSKKNKAAATKILMMSDDIKVELLRKYFRKSKLEYIVCFIEHRLDMNPENYWPSIYQELEEFKNQIKTLEKELFSGIKADPILEWISPHHA